MAERLLTQNNLAGTPEEITVTQMIKKTGTSTYVIEASPNLSLTAYCTPESPPWGGPHVGSTRIFSFRDAQNVLPLVTLNLNVPTENDVPPVHKTTMAYNVR